MRTQPNPNVDSHTKFHRFIIKSIQDHISLPYDVQDIVYIVRDPSIELLFQSQQ